MRSLMKMRPAACAALALLLAAALPARADSPPPPPLPTNEQQVQEQLKTFDPAAVAAARHYYESPKMKEGMLAILRNLTPAIIANQEKARGAALSEQERAKIVGSLDKAMAENFDFLVGMNMIAALEVLPKDDLVALDTFYSSPVGQDILGRMPQISRRLPGIMQIFLPRFMASMQTQLKANGVGTP